MPTHRHPRSGRADPEESFNEFYLATWHRLVTFLYAMTGDLPVAYDLAQEAYARAWQGWHRVVSYPDPEAWLRMVASVLLIDHRPPAPTWTVEPPSMDSLVLLTALRQLPRGQRYAIVLHHLLGVPESEASDQSGAPVIVTRARLAAGRATLSELLGWDLVPQDRASPDPRFSTLYRETGKLRWPSAASLRHRGQQPRWRRRVAVTVAAAVVLLAGGAMVSLALGPERPPSPPTVTTPTVSARIGSPTSAPAAP